MVEELGALLGALLRCTCGHRVAAKLKEKGKRVCIAVYFGFEPTSDTRRERVRECSGCGGVLGRATLAPLDLQG